jgi:hypothetical protein
MNSGAGERSGGVEDARKIYDPTNIPLRPAISCRETLEIPPDS